MRAFASLGVCLCVMGCSSAGLNGPTASETFTLSWTEYPSFNVFRVANDKGLINGKKGMMGSMEKKHGIDIVLQKVDYDVSSSMFNSGKVDACCQTNIDCLAMSLARDSVVILPLSTSAGADTCIAVGFDEKDPAKRNAAILEFLQKNSTHGLVKSVSHYVFERNLVLLDKDVDFQKFKYINMEPDDAAQAIQASNAKVNSIMTWNPFALRTLRKRKDAKVLFDSSTIPEEVIDCVVMGKDSLEKPGGKDFARAMAETYYEVNKMLVAPATQDATYEALAAGYADLGGEDMKKICQATKFYATPARARSLMQSRNFQSVTMPRVVEFCLRHGLVKQKPTVGFNDAKAQLNFDDSYLSSK